MKIEKTVPVMSVKKALDLLGILAFEDVRREGVRLSDLSSRLGLPLNTARNLLKTMICCGFVAQTDESRYIVGPVSQRMGMVNRLASASTTAVVDDALRELSAKLGEGVVFAILSDGNRAALAAVDSNRQIRTMGEPRGSRNFYSYPTARVLTAYASESDRARIIERNGLPGAAWDAIDTPERLDHALAQIRKDGFCVIQEQSTEIVGLAVAALDADGELLGSLGFHAPAFRCPPTRLGQIIEELQTATAELSKKL